MISSEYAIGSQVARTSNSASDYDYALIFEKSPTLNELKKEIVQTRLKYKDIKTDIIPIDLEIIKNNISIGVSFYMNFLAQVEKKQINEIHKINISEEKVFHSATLSIMLILCKVLSEKRSVATKELRSLIWLKHLHLYKDSINFCYCFNAGERLHEEFKKQKYHQIEYWTNEFYERVNLYDREIGSVNSNYSHIDNYYLNKINKDLFNITENKRFDDINYIAVFKEVKNFTK